MDRQWGNILVKTTCRNWKIMREKKEAGAALGKDSYIPEDGNMGGCIAGHMSQEDLAGMGHIEVWEADREALADILEIEIDGNLSGTEKKREFIRQIGNPYLYRQGKYTVKLSFADTDATLTDCLKEYIEHMAAAGL